MAEERSGDEALADFSPTPVSVAPETAISNPERYGGRCRSLSTIAKFIRLSDGSPGHRTGVATIVRSLARGSSVIPKAYILAPSRESFAAAVGEPRRSGGER